MKKETIKQCLEILGLQPNKKDSLIDYEDLMIYLGTNLQEFFTVAEMANAAHVARQTMYDHLPRFIEKGVLIKDRSFVKGNFKHGYKLSGINLRKTLWYAYKMKENKEYHKMKRLIGELQ